MESPWLGREVDILAGVVEKSVLRPAKVSRRSTLRDDENLMLTLPHEDPPPRTAGNQYKDMLHPYAFGTCEQIARPSLIVYIYTALSALWKNSTEFAVQLSYLTSFA